MNLPYTESDDWLVSSVCQKLSGIVETYFKKSTSQAKTLEVDNYMYIFKHPTDRSTLKLF